MLLRNPADLEKKDRPQVEKKGVATIDTDATVDVIDAAREQRLFVAVLLGVHVRPSAWRITALRWKSIDLDRGQLAVIASTEQTKAGVREKEAKGSKSGTLALPGLLVEELRGIGPHRHRYSCALVRALASILTSSRNRTLHQCSRIASPCRL
jgi:integrase